VGAGSGFIAVPDNTALGVGYSPLSGTGVKAGTATSISSSRNPSTYGQSVTFLATVTSLTSGTPAGSVTFVEDGAITLGTVALSGGSAALSTSALVAGTHSISASYGGSTLYLSSSRGLSQVVNPAPTAT